MARTCTTRTHTSGSVVTKIEVPLVRVTVMSVEMVLRVLLTTLPSPLPLAVSLELVRVPELVLAVSLELVRVPELPLAESELGEATSPPLTELDEESPVAAELLLASLLLVVAGLEVAPGSDELDPVVEAEPVVIVPSVETEEATVDEVVRPPFLRSKHEQALVTLIGEYSAKKVGTGAPAVNNAEHSGEACALSPSSVSRSASSTQTEGSVEIVEAVVGVPETEDGLDAGVLDSDMDADMLDSDADELDADMLDSDMVDIDMLGSDADGLDADVLDSDMVDADTLGSDMDIDMLGSEVDELDTDMLDSDMVDADMLETDADGLDADMLDSDMVDIDMLGSDADGLDVDVLDSDMVDADTLGSDMDIDMLGSEVDGLDTDMLDSDMLDADMLETDADGLDDDMLDSDMVDADIVDSDIVDNDMLESDADGLDTEMLDSDIVDADILGSDIVDIDTSESKADELDAETLDSDMDADMLDSDAEELAADTLDADKLDSDKLEADELEDDRLDADRLDAVSLDIGELSIVVSLETAEDRVLLLDRELDVVTLSDTTELNSVLDSVVVASLSEAVLEKVPSVMLMDELEVASGVNDVRIPFLRTGPPDDKKVEQTDDACGLMLSSVSSRASSIQKAGSVGLNETVLELVKVPSVLVIVVIVDGVELTGAEVEDDAVLALTSVLVAALELGVEVAVSTLLDEDRTSELLDDEPTDVVAGSVLLLLMVVGDTMETSDDEAAEDENVSAPLLKLDAKVTDENSEADEE
ncbi:MAG: hypothetical protein M1815_003652 [Lichina confinis]|nr:MAG: hypothetical protein M1815_003652 [Lichina confinis]